MDTCLDIATKIDQQLNLRDCSIVKESDEEVRAERNFQQYDEDEDGSEFSFACAEAASSPISAADLFQNGQIRPISPVFGSGAFQGVAASVRIPLKEAFVERSDLPPASEEVNRVGEESHCNRTETETAAKSPVSCRKSNSTGFSKLWRFRDLLIRSQSDGKEKFVFLTENETTSCSSSSMKKKRSEISKNDKNSSSRNAKKASTAAVSKTTPLKSKGKTTSSSSSSYAMQYGKNGEKGREKRRSYLPYRQDLVGFFTNANAVSRNIHPY